ncbi:neutral/alkaline non-lysosomal ceramidase N-terminal domain-containing protein [Anaeromyxobacter sp. SG64]|uniref:neutral/alkaline non-lysosomal ceramidase N-terminal domain-containing protein n=1 Tax=Anaeromyxobacter sp. SG64 TaxID=2925409 RepID=UPI001F573936|nr:neutral/alkaline non-lysosomal ceramidase N-terminal domain-containing protein [Anaeromyxobacter sp. SG64]
MKKLPATRALRGAAMALAIPVIVLAIASLPWRPERPEEPARIAVAPCGAGALSAGVGEAAFTLPAEAPIAGFARLRWTSEGVRDPVGARALVLGAPGCRIALASAELLVVPEELEAAVRARVEDLGLDGLVLAATHTHAGPGGYWDNLLGERIGAAPYEPRMREAVVAGIAEAIRRAAGALTPVEVQLARGRAEALVRGRGGGPKDARLLAVRLARRGGVPLAELTVLAAHPTTLGKRNRLISGDWPGRFLHEDAAGAGVRLFFQGALGDQSVALPEGGPVTPERYADALSRTVEALRFERVASPALGFATGEVVLPAPAPGALPAILRSAAGNLAYRAVPARAPLSALRLGPVVLAFVPGEPVAEVGEAWRAEAGPGTEIVSLAGGYVGYVDTPEQIAARRGEAVRTYYGPELAARLGHGIEAAVAAVRADPAVRGEAPLRRGAGAEAASRAAGER